MAETIDRAAVEKIVRDVLRDLPEGAGARAATARPRLSRSTSRPGTSTSAPKDFEALFGKGARLTPLRPLYQEGHFAAQETVAIIGPKKPADPGAAHPGPAAGPFAGRAGLHRRHSSGPRKRPGPHVGRRRRHARRLDPGSGRHAGIEAGRHPGGPARPHERARRGPDGRRPQGLPGPQGRGGRAGHLRARPRPRRPRLQARGPHGHGRGERLPPGGGHAACP